MKLGGAAVAQQQVGDQVQHDLKRAELLAFPLLFLLSLLIFRGLIASLLPVLVGGVAIVSTFLVLRLVDQVVGLSVFSINLVTGLGLGLAIDYSLFMVSRYREELAAVGPGEEALRRTVQTAGRTVLFSSLTVAAALASLLVFPQRFLYSMGIGGVAVSLIAATIALVALPALLAALGPRVDALAPRRWQRAAAATGAGFWYRLSRAVMRRPARVAIASAVVLVAWGCPSRRSGSRAWTRASCPRAPRRGRWTRPCAPTSRPPAPIRSTWRSPRRAAPRRAVSAFARRLSALPGARVVDAPRLAGDGLWQVDVIPRRPALASGSKDIVRAIEALPAPFPMKVGGQTAAFLDRQKSLGVPPSPRARARGRDDARRSSS